MGPRVIAIGGLTAVALMAAMMALAGGIGPHVAVFQVAYSLGCLGHAALVVLLVRNGGRLPGAWRWWLAAAIALRAALLWTAPSDDVYRYVWEGRVQRAGVNPYAFSPNDPTLASLRDEDWQQINHRDYPAIYPPLAQLEFRALAAINASPWFFKAVHVLWDVLAVCALGAYLRSTGRSPHGALVYGLCPLVLTAFAVEGHVDSLMLLLLAAAAWAAERKRWQLVGLALGSAVLAKPLPLVLLPYLAWKRLGAAVTCLCVVAAGYAVYASAGAAVFESLRRFAGETVLLSPTFPILAAVFGRWARWMSGAILAAVIVCSLWTAHRGDDTDRMPNSATGFRRRDGRFGAHARFVLAAVVLLSPVVHYWYVTWILFLLVDAFRPSWLVLAGSMVFYFAAERVRTTTGSWAMPDWVWWAVYAPFAVAWLAEAFVLNRRRVSTRQRRTDLLEAQVSGALDHVRLPAVGGERTANGR